MDWTAVLKLAVPYLVPLLQSTVTNLGTSAPPSPTVAHPSDAIKHLQTLLNAVLALNPPLEPDGWLGPKTEAAIEAGIAKLTSLGVS